MTAEFLERRLVVFDQRNHDIPIIRDRGFADDHHVAIVDPCVDHGITLHLQRVMFATATDHPAGDGDRLGHCADRLDRDTGGDPSHHRHIKGRRADRLRCRGGRPIGAVAVDHARGKARTGQAAQAIGQFHHLYRAGAMRKAADESAFLKRCDQTVDAGFGPQIKRFFHLVKAGRHAVALHTFVNKGQQIELFLGQHPDIPRFYLGFVLGMFLFCVNRQRGIQPMISPAVRAPSWGGRTIRTSARDRIPSNELS